MITKPNPYIFVIKDIMDLGNEKHILKCRIVQYKNLNVGLSLPFLDIRSFMTMEKNGRTGYGAGVSLTVKDLHRLKKHLDEIINQLNTIQFQREWQLKHGQIE